MLTFHHQALPTEAEAVEFNCPACKSKGVEGIPSEAVDAVKIAYLIPILKLRNTAIHCTKCDTSIACSATLDRLSQMDATQIDTSLRYHPSDAGKLVAILALILCWVPFVGLILTAFAGVMNRGTVGWHAQMNVIAVIVAVVSTILTFLMMVMPV